MLFHVYILRNPFDEIYIGQTNDLECRLVQHNDSISRGTLYTKRHSGPWTLIHSEEFPAKAEAMRRERQLKSSRGRAGIREQFLA